MLWDLTRRPLGLRPAVSGHNNYFLWGPQGHDGSVVIRLGRARLLKEAGAVLLGKLTTWEFAIGGTAFDTPFPPARNPWNIDHDPAGSSSGSGAAVAAGLCAMAMGSDTGGSIRWPTASRIWAHRLHHV